MKSFHTTYADMFNRKRSDGLAVKRIEIPPLQRDYAQGRDNPDVARKRATFLDALHEAVSGERDLGLDFIYGDVDEHGTLRPLDGQQRLTTLFLLHWFFACRAGTLSQAGGWKRLSYATRQSARLFCERIAEKSLPNDQAVPSAWITDQSWYLFTWRHDPTITAMLCMLDAIAVRFGDLDPLSSWQRLIEPGGSAITFHLLPLSEFGLNEDLYIKMNSRGKPLTEFENFKAGFEELTSREGLEELSDEFKRKVDTVWSDILWEYRGDDFLIDQEFLRYFQFLGEVRAWLTDVDLTSDLDELARRLYGPANLDAAANLRFLFDGFDVWAKRDIRDFFNAHFAIGTPCLGSGETHRVILYRGGHDLFQRCCDLNEGSPGRQREFNLGEGLLLYGVLLHLRHNTPDLSRRLRVVRNLVLASRNELRADNMPKLLRAVEAVVVNGELASLDTFNSDQIEEEKQKARLRASHPQLETTLFQLEDHGLLRGQLRAIDMEPNTLTHRAAVFHALFADPTLWPELTGALLTVGDYSQKVNWRYFQLGSPTDSVRWRQLFTLFGTDKLATTRRVLRDLSMALDPNQPLEPQLLDLQYAWFASQEAAGRWDWRTYLVRYPVMRLGRSGQYVNHKGSLEVHGLAMLDGVSLRGWWRDPYMLAIWTLCEQDKRVDAPWYKSHERKERWMVLNRSGAGLRLVPEGIQLQPPRGKKRRERFYDVCSTFGIEAEDPILHVPQTEDGGDGQDRIMLGAKLVRELLARRL